MFQSIKFIRSLGYDVATKSYKDEYELTDSDFRCIVVVVAGAGAYGWVAVAVIQEYTKRNLNVAANLVKFFLFLHKKYGYSIAKQIEWSERQQFFTPQLKTELNKYLLLL